MFELSFFSYVAAIFVILLLLSLVAVQVRRRKRERTKDHTLYISALQSLLAGDQVGAFYKLKEVVAQDSGNIDAYLRLGKILADRGKVRQAIQIHSDLLLRADLNPAQINEINHFLIEDYMRDGQVDRAIDLLRREFDRDSNNVESGRRLLDLLCQAEKWEEAEDLAEKLYKRDPDQFRSRVAEVKIRLADKFRAAGRGRKARVLYKSANQIDNKRVDVWVKIGDSYIEEDRTEDAVKAWMELTDKAPANSYVVFDRLRSSLFDLGQFNQITGIFERILERDLNNTSALMALAELSYKKGDHSQALEYYRQVLNVDPRFTPANLGVARIYREQGRLHDALDILERQLYEVAVEEQQS